MTHTPLDIADGVTDTDGGTVRIYSIDYIQDANGIPITPYEVEKQGNFALFRFYQNYREIDPLHIVVAVETPQKKQRMLLQWTELILERNGEEILTMRKEATYEEDPDRHTAKVTFRRFHYMDITNDRGTTVIQVSLPVLQSIEKQAETEYRYQNTKR